MSDQKQQNSEKHQSLVPWQDQLPSVKLPQHKLMKQLGRLQAIGIAAKAAQDELGNTFTHSQFKTLSALDTAARLRVAFSDVVESPEAGDSLMRDTQEFLRMMQGVSQEAGMQILREQQRVPEYLGNDNPIEKLRSFLFGD